MSAPSSPHLSVLVPTYNYGSFLHQALESVLDQRVPGVEIVVADDGSTDDTPERVRDLVSTGRIRYFRQENAGVSAARNLAMARARGRYLLFLDADDALLPGCLQATLDFLGRYPEVGFFFPNYDIFDEEGVIAPSGVDTWESFRELPHREPRPREWIFEGSLAPAIVRHGSFMHTSGLTVRREVAEAAGPFRVGYSYGEDDEFFARVARRCTAGYLDRVLARKRNHPGSLIHDPSRRAQNMRHLLELSEIQRREYGDDPELSRFLNQRIRRVAADCIWESIQAGQTGVARSLVRRYLARYPLEPRFYRLALKAMVSRTSP